MLRHILPSAVSGEKIKHSQESAGQLKEWPGKKDDINTIISATVFFQFKVC